MPGAAYVYMLRCHSPRGDSFYTGWTVDVSRRLEQHQAGKGGRYTRSHLPVELVYQEKCPTRQAAMRRECEIKKMTRTGKLALIRPPARSLKSQEGQKEP
ncbi:MAG: GIY-YIG nuclease family protein [Fretibacterium sp.]|nr:GIY-YIG nuclease family protein [Fretibacterium sp.]